MKQIELRRSNPEVNLNQVFSASIRGGSRGFGEIMAMEPFSNDVFPTLRTIIGFNVTSVIYETK